MKESENIMHTSSMIGIYNKEDGSVTASYCYYDGYLAHNGRVLVESYNAQRRAEIVAKGGYLLALTGDYAESSAFESPNDPAVEYASVEDFLRNGYDYASAQYLYLFDGEAWFYAQVSSRVLKTDRRFEEVEMNLTNLT